LPSKFIFRHVKGFFFFAFLSGKPESLTPLHVHILVTLVSLLLLRTVLLLTSIKLYRFYLIRY